MLCDDLASTGPQRLVLPGCQHQFPFTQLTESSDEVLAVQAVKSFGLPAAATAAHIAALAQLTAARKIEGSKAAIWPTVDIETWTKKVLAAAEAALSTHVQQCAEAGSGGDVMTPADWQATAAVFTAGEVLSWCSYTPSIAGSHD